MSITFHGAAAWLLIIYAGKALVDRGAAIQQPYRKILLTIGVLMMLGGANGIVIEGAMLIWP